MECQLRQSQNADEEWQPLPRVCDYGAVCGRPFLVGGSARQAAPEQRADWLSASASPDVSSLDARTRQTLAAHWTGLGLMEHASVAAFARFVLELMAAGAPPDLVSAAQRAQGDEIEHARLCFGLASSYAAKPVGPGALSARGVLDETGLLATVRAAIHEACVGETLAAVEALEALAGTTDLAVCEVLEKVVRDETAHAELGWKFLQWALVGASNELRSMAHLELHRAIDSAMAAARPIEARDEPAALERHGLCPTAQRCAARQAALRQVVIPLATTLLETRTVDAPRMNLLSALAV